ncbi:MAG: hypothetical protein JJU29_01295 [Verrucomicrobia bacterium]|nr:hypothetical protein [Verrucomicrobiota bacterium]MCH8510457.1 hypothetical protein [Kiritimatiellia bacterium]
MKLPLILLTCLFAAAWSVAEDARPETVRMGDSADDVVRILGEPNSRIETEETAWFTFDRGEVRLKNDRVVYVSLVSAEKAEARKQAEAEARAERIREGEALRKAVLEDPGYEFRAPHEKLEIWTRFQERFPEVDVSGPYQLARLEVARETEREVNRQRLAELERRVRIAEAQAQQAQFEAQFQRTTYQPPIEYRTRSHTTRRGGYAGPVITFRPYPGTSSRVEGQIRVPSQTSTVVEERHQGSGYVHGRSHGLRHERSTFSW